MKTIARLCCVAATISGFFALPSLAQPRLGWGYQIDGLAAYQGDAELGEGGEFSASRVFLRTTALYTFQDDTSLGLSFSLFLFLSLLLLLFAV